MKSQNFSYQPRARALEVFAYKITSCSERLMTLILTSKSFSYTCQAVQCPLWGFNYFRKGHHRRRCNSGIRNIFVLSFYRSMYKFAMLLESSWFRFRRECGPIETFCTCFRPDSGGEFVCNGLEGFLLRVSHRLARSRAGTY